MWIAAARRLVKEERGAGALAVGTQVNFAALQKSFLVPLLLSPVVAIALGAVIYLGLRFLRLKFGITKEWCMCLGSEERLVVMPQPLSALSRQETSPEYSLMVAESRTCAERYAGAFLGLRSQQIMDVAHFLSAGVVCFARSLNDTRIKDRLRGEVEAAVGCGVFGSPFIVIDGEPFWGSDRLEQVEKWLATGGW